MSAASPRVLVSGLVLDQPMGGVRRHNQELLPRLAERLAAAGGELCLLTGRGGVAFELASSIRALQSAVPSHPVAVRASLEGRELRRQIAAAQAEGRPFDLVHTGHLPAPRCPGVLASLTLHDLRALDLEHTPMSRRLVAQSILGGALRRAAVVLTVSEHVRARLLERFRLPAARVVAIGNGSDHFEPMPRAAQPAELLHVGHLEPRKNLELALRALALAPHLPPLCLAGGAKADMQARLAGLARELGVAERVRFLGAFDERELAALYARAACVVVPSRLEGFGLAVVEALRARAPVAVAQAGALPEVGGPHVETFGPDDPAGCAAAIGRALLRSAAQRDAGRRWADGFTWERAAERCWSAWMGALGAA